MKTKKKNTSRYLMNGIPNNEEGLALIDEMNKYLNKDQYVIKKRGSGSRVKVAKALGEHPRSYDNGIPLKYAETIRVYIESKPFSEFEIKQNTLETNQRIDELRRLNSDLYRRVAELYHKLVTIRSTLKVICEEDTSNLIADFHLGG